MAHTTDSMESPPAQTRSGVHTGSKTLRALGSRIHDIIRRLRQRPARYRKLRELRALDDRLLKDIGLRRSDITAAIVYGRSGGLVRHGLQSLAA
jgi:uncharacterized protein YjiS (DUF1127 family)